VGSIVVRLFSGEKPFPVENLRKYTIKTKLKKKMGALFRYFYSIVRITKCNYIE